MERYQFDDIINNILIPYLNYAEKETKIHIDLRKDFKDKVYDKYQTMRDNIKKNFMKNVKNRIDRHKVASLFYVAFVDVAKEAGFRDFKTYNLNSDEAIYLFVHNAAFNVAIGIIENFICTPDSENEHTEEYRLYVKKHGIVEQMKEYSNDAIKEFISTQKTGMLSPLLLANIFFLIELNSKSSLKNINTDRQMEKSL